MRIHNVLNQFWYLQRRSVGMKKELGCLRNGISSFFCLLSSYLAKTSFFTHLPVFRNLLDRQIRKFSLSITSVQQYLVTLRLLSYQTGEQLMVRLLFRIHQIKGEWINYCLQVSWQPVVVDGTELLISWNWKSFDYFVRFLDCPEVQSESEGV